MDSALPIPHSAFGFSTQMIEIIFNGDLSCAKFLQPVRFTDADGTIYELPANQPTDFASTPKTVWGFPLYLIPTGWWSIPAGFHDSAFQNLLLIVEKSPFPRPPGGEDQGEAAAPLSNKIYQPEYTETKRLANLTEQQSNALLKRMMQAIKPSPTIQERLQMDAIYEGVSLGGWHAFKQDRS